MSRMLEALQNLSSQADAPAGNDTPQEAATQQPAAVPGPVLGPILTPADHSRRMKELLGKHLSPPRPSELLRNLKAELQRPIERPAGMTVPLEPTRLARPLLPPKMDDGEDGESSDRESISLTFPMSEAAPIASRLIGGVENLLSAIEEDVETAGEEIAVSFAGEERESDQRSEVGGQASDQGPAVGSQEESIRGSGFRIQDLAVVGSEFRVPVSEMHGSEPENGVPSSTVEQVPDAPQPASPLQLAADISQPETRNPEPGAQNPQPETGNPEPDIQNPVPEIQAAEPAAQAAAASPLEHLVDARPLVETRPEPAEPAPAPVPLTLPPRTISRSKTRLEQRVVEGLADPTRSKPYRDLADRLAQDLRQLTGRCLLFSGVGPASHGDDLLAHLGALMAEDEAEVLLVDADFKRAGLSVGLGALKETGLGELQERGAHAEELILPTLLPNVSLLPAGRRALSDSLGVVDHLAQLLAKLEGRFALIVIDGGSHAQPLSPSLARLCDATYFIVRLGATEARTATTALKTFRASGARVMGCVATTAS